jgi:hypothetical protein
MRLLSVQNVRPNDLPYIAYCKKKNRNAAISVIITVPSVDPIPTSLFQNHREKLIAHLSVHLTLCNFIICIFPNTFQNSPKNLVQVMYKIALTLPFKISSNGELDSN